MKVLPNGDGALLAEFGSLDEVLAFYRGAVASRPSSVIDLVPGARTVLVTCEPRMLPAVRDWLDSVVPVSASLGASSAVEIEVRYDGADLSEVAGLLGMSVADVIELHTASTWTVAFGGFAPGFGYLVTDHVRLVVPRRSSPRTLVPAGAVGLAGEFSGVYPRASPGGWQLIGTTDAVLFDASLAAPALLAPGTTVKFRDAAR